ncbi:MAG: DUF2442 domain-containing protein [Candidatus Omnitrophica bacterium]|nr:DUF2442 domain-containing protein [Candidatus Omnitrophota bacterium]
MFKPVEIKALPKYKLWIRFEDGVNGEVDLSHLVGKGVFSVWKDEITFKKVRIGERGELVWGADIALCPDSSYIQISGRLPEQVFPNLQKRSA